MKAGFKVGDRVDFGAWRNGEVLRIGKGTIYAVFDTAFGKLPANGPASQFRHYTPLVLRVGAFSLRATGPGKVFIDHAGGGMEVDEAKFESVLEGFYGKEF